MSTATTLHLNDLKITFLCPEQEEDFLFPNQTFVIFSIEISLSMIDEQEMDFNDIFLKLTHRQFNIQHRFLYSQSDSIDCDLLDESRVYENPSRQY